MCFGNQVTQTGTQTTPDYLQGAAQQNISQAQNLQTQGFTPYGGRQVAPFSAQQQQSFGMGTDIANATAGNIMPGANALNYALNASTGANAPRISANTISSGMSPYMSQYVGMALAPQLQAQANAYMLQNQGMQGQATSAGAFGDPRAGILQGNLGLNYALENQGLVGNAYNNAFNTAIGASAQDVANSLTAQQGNANIWNQSIQDSIAASNAQFGQATSANTMLNTLGAQQTAQTQAQLDAQYNQWLMAMQYPFQTSQNLSSSIGASLPTNVTTTNTAPDNSGYAILGGILGAGVGGYARGLGSKAEGGPVEEGEPYVVGERGPELIIPKTSGTVVPYPQLKAAVERKRDLHVPKANPSKLTSNQMQFGIAA